MTRRHSGSAGGWDVRTYRSPLWKYFHPVKYLRAEYRIAKRAMRPRRVVARGMSFDQFAEFWRTKTTKMNEKKRRKQVATAQRR